MGGKGFTYMKRIAALLAVACVAAAFVAPAEAGKVKTFKHTVYLHGTQQAGEAEAPDTWVGGIWMKMDGTKPAGDPPKSVFVTNYVGGPNTNCSGNGLLPVWAGDMKGTIKGTVTVALHTVASPAASLEARLYPDANGGCNESRDGSRAPRRSSKSLRDRASRRSSSRRSTSRCCPDSYFS